ncbi:MAG: aminotransferase class III-fold pyridoxal phosphate-dependent enzyme [Bdellovibrionaceae bacterium]|nr:aminotransferase class III-fold pyridoxal phosphate-dependent enzyme [Pseudobdellovibrionaceae bacterium]
MSTDLIEQLVAQIQDRSKTLTEPKASDDNKKEEYHHFLKSIGNLRGRPLYYPYLSSGLGKGPFVQLLDGSVKLDFICGIGAHILGHSHPELLKSSIEGALEDTVMQGNLMMNKIYLKVLEKLIGIAGKNSGLAHAWFAPSGSMANENALKVIRQKKEGARKILAFERAFAGRSMMMCEITDNPAIKQGLPSYNEVLRVPFCPDEPDKALKVLKQHWETEKDNIACFIVELMQGDGGYFLAERDFFVPLLDFCKTKGLALWFDEVQTFGRSGEFFAFEKLELGEYVDVCTIGKGFQMSASLWTKEYNPKPGLVSGTFASSSSSFHSALVVLNTLESFIKEGRIKRIHQAWKERLETLEKESLISQIEGWGLMWGATPLNSRPDQVSQLLQILFEKGLICFSCGQGDVKRLRFLLPAVVEEKHLDQGISILREGILSLKK